MAACCVVDTLIGSSARAAPSGDVSCTPFLRVGPRPSGHTPFILHPRSCAGGERDGVHQKVSAGQEPLCRRFSVVQPPCGGRQRLSGGAGHAGQRRAGGRRLLAAVAVWPHLRRAVGGPAGGRCHRVCGHGGSARQHRCDHRDPGGPLHPGGWRGAGRAVHRGGGGHSRGGWHRQPGLAAGGWRCARRLGRGSGGRHRLRGRPAGRLGCGVPWQAAAPGRRLRGAGPHCPRPGGVWQGPARGRPSDRRSGPAGGEICAGPGYGVFAGLHVQQETWEASAQVWSRERPEGLRSGVWLGPSAV